MPFESTLPSLDKSSLLEAFAHFMALQADLLNLLKLRSDSLESDSFLSLVHGNSEFNQASNLSCEELISHVGLI